MRLINDHTGEYLEVLSDFGAGLNDLQVRNGKNQLVSVIDGYRTEEEIESKHYTSFKGSKLSPFPNRIPDGLYQFGGTSYQLPITEIGANNNLHALLHDKPFETLEATADNDGAILKLAYQYKANEAGYPFYYNLILSYRFDRTGATIRTEIQNAGDSAIPMGDGWHPYFHFEDLDQIEMQMGAATRLSSNVGNVLSDVHGFEENVLLADKNLDDCFETQLDGEYEILLKDHVQGIELKICQESQVGKYKYFQIYTPPARRSIAIEPVTCPPNAFNTGIGLLELEPKQEVSMTFGINYKLLNN